MSNRPLRSRNVAVEKENLTSFSKPIQRRWTLPAQLPDFSEHLELMNSFEVEFDLEECLQRHRLTEAHRARVVDWVIEVLAIYKTSQRTVYLAVKLLDIYLAKTSGLQVHHLQLVCLTCMFIASKYEDMRPFTLDTICTQISYNQVSKSSVLAEEKALLSMVDYNLFFPTLHDWLELSLQHCPPSTCKFAWVMADISLLSTQLVGLPPKQVAAAICRFALQKTGAPLTPLEPELVPICRALEHRYERYKHEHHLPAIKSKYQIDH